LFEFKLASLFSILQNFLLLLNYRDPCSCGSFGLPTPKRKIKLWAAGPTNTPEIDVSEAYSFPKQGSGQRFFFFATLTFRNQTWLNLIE
jgi:hypothetical protein